MKRRSSAGSGGSIRNLDNGQTENNIRTLNYKLRYAVAAAVVVIVVSLFMFINNKQNDKELIVDKLELKSDKIVL